MVWSLPRSMSVFFDVAFSCGSLVGVRVRIGHEPSTACIISSGVYHSPPLLCKDAFLHSLIFSFFLLFVSIVVVIVVAVLLSPDVISSVVDWAYSSSSAPSSIFSSSSTLFLAMM